MCVQDRLDEALEAARRWARASHAQAQTGDRAILRLGEGLQPPLRSLTTRMLSVAEVFRHERTLHMTASPCGDGWVYAWVHKRGALRDGVGRQGNVEKMEDYCHVAAGAVEEVGEPHHAVEEASHLLQTGMRVHVHVSSSAATPS